MVFKLQHLKSSHADLYIHMHLMWEDVQCPFPSSDGKNYTPTYTSQPKVETNIFLFISEVAASERVTRKKLGGILPILPPSLGYTFVLQSAGFLLSH